MKKILLLLTALFVMGGVEVSAKKYYADLSTASTTGNATWTKETNTFAWTASSYAFMVVPGGSFSGDLSEYTTIGLTVADIENGFRVDILANGKTFTGKGITTNGQIVLNILEDFNLQWSPDKITKEDLKQVTAIRFNTNSENGKATVTKFYIAKPAALLFDDEGNAEFDLSDLVATGGLSFDEETGVLTNDGTGGTLSINLPAEGIDFSNFTSLTVERSGEDLIANSEIKDETNNIENGFWGSKYGVNFTQGDAMKFNKATNVNVINFIGKAEVGSMTISAIKVKANVIACKLPGDPVVLNTLPYYAMNGTPATATWNVGVSSDTYYGSGQSAATNYVDLTGYEELRIHRGDKTGFRAFFINASAAGTNNINNNTSDVVSWDEVGSYWKIDLSKVEKYNGKIYLNTIKSESWGTKNVITNITLYKTPQGAANYILSGKGTFTPATQSALADASAKVIDATGVTGTNVALESANPNCIFLANAGTLSNTKNVQIGNTIENLEITDKKPLADLTGVTATDATYTRSMTNQFGTICLPYAVKSTESVKYYTIDNLDGDVLTLQEETELAAGTPAIVEKVSGESITAEGSGALVAAGAPTGNLELIGTFEEKTVLAADYAGKNIYAIKNNQFVQGLNSITVPAFRAYFTAAASAGANLRLAFGDEATAIDSLTGEKSIKAIYSVSGASQASLQKGMNIVEFTDGSVKKVMVK